MIELLKTFDPGYLAFVLVLMIVLIVIFAAMVRELIIFLAPDCSCKAHEACMKCYDKKMQS